MVPEASRCYPARPGVADLGSLMQAAKVTPARLPGAQCLEAHSHHPQKLPHRVHYAWVLPQSSLQRTDSGHRQRRLQTADVSVRLRTAAETTLSHRFLVLMGSQEI